MGSYDWKINTVVSIHPFPLEIQFIHSNMEWINSPSRDSMLFHEDQVAMRIEPKKNDKLITCYKSVKESV